MKLKLIEIPIFVMVISIALVLVGKNIEHTSKTSLSMLSLKEINTCKREKQCITTGKITGGIKSDLNPIKEIRTFIRKKIY
ncbi:hypothetical protein REJ26_003935 [Providencia stuartii]|uniref:Uncharacterized protein n=1 Tax=Providencia stuartii TaxID=588 RepID=A0A1S1HQK8_PROST|nr:MULTISPECIES: hypothetical protein [Providencia]MDV5224785.1 hypothetical protein [Providencia rettgeri]ELR5041334.1 hypothetical protein [Providencia stuartii]ELR5080807.1 hypothetical protein [Providencia stuartii]ELR5302123.1 hypothetical protein [Providencia stuartii]MDW7590614.1 hypothetical protein [Providencia sp. 2023EL-00965]